MVGVVLFAPVELRQNFLFLHCRCPPGFSGTRGGPDPLVGVPGPAAKRPCFCTWAPYVHMYLYLVQHNTTVNLYPLSKTEMQWTWSSSRLLTPPGVAQSAA